MLDVVCVVCVCIEDCFAFGQQNDYKTKRLSSHYSSLLADQEAQIETLREKETSLQKSLNDRLTSETNLRQERKQLISVRTPSSIVLWHDRT